MLELPYKAAVEDIADELAFLDEGTRGFIFRVDELTEPVIVEVGDEVFLRA